MAVQSLNCPMCGAAASSDAVRCEYCQARLAVVACSSCFGMIFAGSKHCSHCGARAARQDDENLSPRECPHCRRPMDPIKLESSTLDECANCGGLWVDTLSFEQICTDREHQTAVLGAAAPERTSRSANSTKNAVRYVPCPLCKKLMNRVHFARCSGVVVDVCKKHGTWFDRDELRRIVEFIRSGGMETARKKEKEEITEARNKLRDARLFGPRDTHARGGLGDPELRSSVLAAEGLLKLFQR